MNAHLLEPSAGSNPPPRMLGISQEDAGFAADDHPRIALEAVSSRQEFNRVGEGRGHPHIGCCIKQSELGR